jgi:hypothetical protein
MRWALIPGEAAIMHKAMMTGVIIFMAFMFLVNDTIKINKNPIARSIYNGDGRGWLFFNALFYNT